MTITPLHARDNSVSVVIPVYNGANFIAEAVRSALNQTVPPMEIIVVNDGSTDETLSVLEEFGSSITLLQQEQLGNAAARNAGGLLAKGSWIAVLDADDIWESTKLEHQLAVASEADVIYTNVRNFGESQSVRELSFQPGEMPQGDVLRPLLLDNFITHSSVLMRRSLVQKVGGYDESLWSCCDWDLLLRLAAARARFAALETPLVRYRWRPDSVSKDHQQSFRNRLRVVERALEAMPSTRSNRKLGRQSLGAAWRTSAWFVSKTDEWQALQWYLRSLRNEPLNKRTWLEVARLTAHQFGLSRALLRDLLHISTTYPNLIGGSIYELRNDHRSPAVRSADHRRHRVLAVQKERR